jgi:hypothetical protein
MTRSLRRRDRSSRRERAREMGKKEGEEGR